MFVTLLCLLHGGAPWVQNLPTSRHESRLHCRKIAVAELLFLERFEQSQLLPCSITQTQVLSVGESVLQHAGFIAVSLIYCDFVLKKNCYLTLYLTSKLLLLVVSSAMFIFHQIMFVSNVCKS